MRVYTNRQCNRQSNKYDCTQALWQRVCLPLSDDKTGSARQQRHTSQPQTTVLNQQTGLIEDKTTGQIICHLLCSRLDVLCDQHCHMLKHEFHLVCVGANMHSHRLTEFAVKMLHSSDCDIVTSGIYCCVVMSEMIVCESVHRRIVDWSRSWKTLREDLCVQRRKFCVQSKNVSNFTKQTKHFTTKWVWLWTLHFTNTKQHCFV